MSSPLARLGSYLKDCRKVILHPRTSAMAEVTYATHGLLHGDSLVVWLVYSLLLVVSLAHLVWAHLE